MTGTATIAGLALAMIAWLLAGLRLGMTGHMAAHMIAVALAAPLLAWGLAGKRLDPARLWPWLTPLPASLIELIVVWAWHVPAARRLAAEPAGLILEQGSFLIAGLALWSSALGAARDQRMARRAGGVAALLLTSMHMTLLGVLIGLAPQPLYPHHHGAMALLDPLADQQLGGVVMLVIGTGSYLAGGLLLLSTLLADRRAKA